MPSTVRNSSRVSTRSSVQKKVTAKKTQKSLSEKKTGAKKKVRTAKISINSTIEEVEEMMDNTKNLFPLEILLMN